MLLWKPAVCRYSTVLYNEQATDHGDKRQEMQTQTDMETQDRLVEVECAELWIAAAVIHFIAGQRRIGSG